ncbi:MAG: porin family protein [Prevotellaceae bacterium]|jgi:hypothetical protein|nr:porin family protein [Prevotellaceae bacterium]
MSKDLKSGFEELIRNKLEDYRVPVDPSNWNAIENSLIRRKRSKYIYAAASIAAAAVLFLITLNLPLNKNTASEDIGKQIAQEPTKPKSKPDQQISEKKTEQKQSVSDPISTYNAAVNTIIAQVEIPEAQPENPPITEKTKFINQSVSSISINFSTPNKLQLPNNMHFIETLNNKSIDKKNDNYLPDNKKNRKISLDKNEQENKGWSVSMNFGAGNYQNVNSNSKNSDLIMSTPLLTSSNSTDYVKNKYKNEINVPDNAGLQYGLPLSAKFIVRKDLNARLAVESGVSYTYLPTKYKWNKHTANQQLHYLGIPLNVVCYVVSKPNWNIYASAGGMVEKGVYSYIQRSDDLVTKPKMEGLQWSVNGALGVTYKLRKGLGMFFEPQLGYFFDNEQPESIRTKWPVSFGLGIGLRFSL